MARPKSLLTGRDMKITWSANWDDDLAGAQRARGGRPDPGQDVGPGADGVRAGVHVLPAAHLRALPQPVLRGVLPVRRDVQARRGRHRAGRPGPCRGWRMCVTGCPYKKVYFNHRTGKAEKCTFCFPRIEVGMPTVCSETCVGRLRYIGLMLYDADAVLAGGRGREREGAVRGAALGVPRPARPGGDRRGRGGAGIPEDWIDAAQRSPIYELIMTYRGGAAAAPGVPHHADGLVHPAAVAGRRRRARHRPRRRGRGNLFAAIDALRIPVEYLAELFTAGDPAPVDGGAAQARGDARRTCARVNSARSATRRIAAAVGMTGEQMEDMYRLLAIAKYDDRYVIPAAHAETAARAGGAGERVQPRLRGRPGHGRRARSARPPAVPQPIAVENFHALATGSAPTASPTRRTRTGPHQPAELGRQGPARRTVPGSQGGVMIASRTDRRGRRPRRHRCCCATRTASLSALPVAAQALAALPPLLADRCPLWSSTSVRRRIRPRSRSSTWRRSTCAGAAACT